MFSRKACVYEIPISIFDCCLKYMIIDYIHRLLRMDELASVPVRTIQLLVELGAWACFVHRGNVFLFLELVLSVGEGATLTITALALVNPLAAELCFDFEFVVFGNYPSIAFKGYWILRAFSTLLKSPNKLLGLVAVFENRILQLNLVLYPPDFGVELLVLLRGQGMGSITQRLILGGSIGGLLGITVSHL